MSDQDNQPQEPEINEHGIVVGTEPSFEDLMRMQRVIWAAQAEQQAAEDADRKVDEAVVKKAAKRKAGTAS